MKSELTRKLLALGPQSRSKRKRRRKWRVRIKMIIFK